jgi:hypothetical protein
VLHRPLEPKQYTSLVFTEALRDAGITGSIGSVGDALDNALIESTIGLFKTEVIDLEHRSWTSWRQVEQAVAAWVHWFNHSRPTPRSGTSHPSNTRPPTMRQPPATARRSRPKQALRRIQGGSPQPSPSPNNEHTSSARTREGAPVTQVGSHATSDHPHSWRVLAWRLVQVFLPQHWAARSTLNGCST